MVRAKFMCVRKETANLGASTEETGFIVSLEPVVQGSEENDRFYQYTPYGRVELGTINSDAASQFEEGKEYYLDFTPA